MEIAYVITIFLANIVYLYFKYYYFLEFVLLVGILLFITDAIKVKELYKILKRKFKIKL